MEIKLCFDLNKSIFDKLVEVGAITKVSQQTHFVDNEPFEIGSLFANPDQIGFLDEIRIQTGDRNNTTTIQIYDVELSIYEKLDKADLLESKQVVDSEYTLVHYGSIKDTTIGLYTKNLR